jgi:hypothetical protein
MEFSEIMLVWQGDNPNLLKNILGMYSDENQEDLMNGNNRFKILLCHCSS